jgi:hypothetical protein
MFKALMAKGILMKCLASIAVLAMVGVGSFSYLNNPDGNLSFDPQKINLQLSNDGVAWSDGVTETWTMSGMWPGQSTVEGTLYFKNSSELAGDYINIEVSNTCIDPGFGAGSNEESDTLNGAALMDCYLQIEELRYDSTNLLYMDADDPVVDNDDPKTAWNEIDDINGNGFIDLNDFQAQSIAELTPPPAPDGGSITSLTMEVKFHKSAGNDYIGDEVIMEMTIELVRL